MNPNKTTPRRIKWPEITKVVQRQLREFDTKPTLRGMFYRLVSLQLIPNTYNSYTSFGKEMVRARLDGRLPIDCFEDNTRRSVAYFNEDYLTPQELVDSRITELQDTESDYTEFIPKWQDQPHYVEAWIEKDAMTNTFVSHLDPLEVRVVPNRGTTSLTFLYENIKRLEQKQRGGKAVHILCYGDLDPSGDFMMTVDIPRRMKELGFNIKANGGSYEIVAVTEEQVHKYNLPWDPDPPTRAKIQNDSKLSYYLRKYDRVYAVELDVAGNYPGHI